MKSYFYVFIGMALNLKISLMSIAFSVLSVHPFIHGHGMPSVAGFFCFFWLHLYLYLDLATFLVKFIDFSYWCYKYCLFFHYIFWSLFVHMKAKILYIYSFCAHSSFYILLLFVVGFQLIFLGFHNVMIIYKIIPSTDNPFLSNTTTFSYNYIDTVFSIRKIT